MKTVGKGCLELLVAWAIFGGLLYFLLGARFEPPGGMYGSLGGGFLLACSWGLLRNVVLAVKRCSLISASDTARQPQDGKAYAAVGRIKALGRPLSTPFTRKDCVLYSYEFYKETERTYRSGKERRTERVKTMFLSGYAMTPCGVRTPTREVRVIGFPVPDQFPQNVLDASLCEAQIRDYNSSTTFTELKKWEIGKMLGKMKELLQEDDGVLREDWRFEEAADVFQAQPSFSGLECMEQYVPDGAEICLIGTYSMRNGGLIQDLSTGGLEMFAGSANDALRALRSRAVGYFVFAILLALIGTGGVYGILAARESSPDIRDAYRTRFEQAIATDDLALAEKCIQRGVSVNADDGSGRPLVLRAKSDRMFGLFKRNGLDPNLRSTDGSPLLLLAVDTGDKVFVERLLASGADPNAMHPKWKRTPLEAAYDDGNWELVTLLRAKGAKGTLAAAERGTALTSDREGFVQLVDAYVAALNGNDAEGAKRATDDWPPDFFESVSRGLYAGARPAEFVFRAAFLSGDVATVLLSGVGDESLWVYTFVRRPSGWRIRREAWDDEGNWAEKIP